MAARKAGNPDSAAQKPIPISIPRSGDWLDTFDSPRDLISRPSPEPEAPAVAVEEPRREEPAAAAPTRTAAVAEPVAEPVAQPEVVEEEQPQQPPQPLKKKVTKKAAAKRRGPEPGADKGKRPKKRPKRADIGFRDDLEEASSKLRKLVISQGQEDYVTRTDVVAQATCAVARAMDSIQCTQVQRRGHYSSPSAAAYDAALQEAFYRGVAIHYLESNIHTLPDRLLEQCYQHYRQRNGLDED